MEVYHVNLAWNSPSIALVVFLCLIGNYGCSSLLEQYRLSAKEFKKSTLLGKRLVVCLMVFVLGFICISGTYMAGFASARFDSSDNSKNSFPILLNVTMLSAGAVVSSLASFVGLGVSVYGMHQNGVSANNKDGEDVIESFVTRAKSELVQSSQVSKKSNKSGALHLGEALLAGLPYLFVGGIIFGGGLVSSLNLYMKSLEVKSYNVSVGISPLAFFGGSIFAVVEGISLLGILTKVLINYPSHEYVRHACIIVMTLLIIGNYFVGCKSFKYKLILDLEDNPTHGSVASVGLYRWIITGLVLFLGVILMLAIANMRLWYQRLAMIVKEADASYEDLAKNSQSPSSKANFIAAYEELRNIDGTKTDIERIQKRRRSKAKVADSPRNFPDFPVISPERHKADPETLLSSCQDNRLEEGIQVGLDVKGMTSSLFFENTDHTVKHDVAQSMKSTILQTSGGNAETISTDTTDSTLVYRPLPGQIPSVAFKSPNVSALTMPLSNDGSTHWIASVGAKPVYVASPSSPSSSESDSHPVRITRKVHRFTDIESGLPKASISSHSDDIIMESPRSFTEIRRKPRSPTI